jgi:hypothetical protein
MEPSTNPSEPEIDPRKVFERAPEILNALANLSAAVIESWAQYHASPKVRQLAGDAVALIVSLRKEDAPQQK